MMHRTAEFSADRFYRHRLDRWWGPGPRVGWFMCNPSDAGEESDDPTVKKCIGFTARWNYSGLVVINPWDMVLTYPEDLPRALVPCSPVNGKFIAQAVNEIDLLIVAWGCSIVVKKMRGRGMDPNEMVRIIREGRPELPIQCLGRTDFGEPRHPLMLAYSTPREPFEVRT
jgi:hypothetical protein